jgi:quercetin dioxygenase-like cupin family protein
MRGKFVIASAAERETLEWGTLGWMSRPTTTGARELVVIEVTLSPGRGHNFHKHPDQEEVIYVLEGEVEQWLEAERRVLHPGDAVFIQGNAVHASFNISTAPARLLAILGPCVGDGRSRAVAKSARNRRPPKPVPPKP